jgi:t-SNARE complex subunit (syntaxin)
MNENASRSNELAIALQERHEDLQLLSEKLDRIKKSWKSLCKYGEKIQKSNNDIIKELNLSQDYLSSAKMHTKHGLEAFQKRIKCLFVFAISLSAIIVIVFLVDIYV